MNSREGGKLQGKFGYFQVEDSRTQGLPLGESERERLIQRQKVGGLTSGLECQAERVGYSL